MLTVSDMMTPAPLTVRSDAGIVATAELMQTRRIGAVLVIDAQRGLGIVTERDILKLVAGGRLDAFGGSIARITTWTPQVASQSESHLDACRRMAVGGFRHLPVVDHAGQPVGMLTASDLIAHQIFFVDGGPDDQPAHRREKIPPATAVNAVVHLAKTQESRMRRYLKVLALQVLEVPDATAAWSSLQERAAVMVVVDRDCMTVETKRFLTQIRGEKELHYVHRVVELAIGPYIEMVSQGDAVGDDFISTEAHVSDVLARLRLGHELATARYRLASSSGVSH